jgi:formylglycine-generating enzyme required for sulfatase activity
MDLAEGKSLREWLKAKWKAGETVSLPEALPILRQVASALDYAHGMKVAHRDVKPGNIMIDGQGGVRVLDFGLASQIQASLSRVSRDTGGTSGTRSYMAPEQWEGHKQDAKTDQYALAAMAYEMLAGQLPFEGADFAMLTDAVLHGTPEAIPGLDKGAMAALRRGMAKTRAERFGSCGEFVEALGGGGRHGSGVGRWRAALLVAAGLLAAVAWWWQGRPTAAPQEGGTAGGTVAGPGEEAEPVAEARQDAAPPERTAELQRQLEEAKSLAEEEAQARKALEARIERLERQEKEGAAAPVPAANSSGETHRPGEERTITLKGGVQMVFVWCPPGEFMMGSPAGEDWRWANETQHRVTLTKGFWMAKTEVTQKQWQSVMGTTVGQQLQLDKFLRFGSLNGNGEGPDHPMYLVSWDECQEFCRKTGLRLPTEAEWEYACRAGNTTEYFWGDALNGDRANCNGNYPHGTDKKGPYLEKTAPVGSYPANRWGLHDMHGNVAEWCEDWCGSYGGDAERDPKGPSSGLSRVHRGGGWFQDAEACRSARRGGLLPDFRSGSVGFRPAKDSIP